MAMFGIWEYYGVRGGVELQSYFSPFLPVLTEPCGSQNASFLLEKIHLRPFGRGSAVFSKETRDQAYSFSFFFSSDTCKFWRRGD